MPRSRPAWARCSSSRFAMPRPWWASWTRNATSASTTRSARLLRRDPVEAAHRDHLAGHGQHERHPVDVVHVGEPQHVALGQPRHRREEPEVLRLGGDLLVEGDQQLLVVRVDRAQVGHLPVPQQHVGLPVPGVRRVRLRSWSRSESTVLGGPAACPRSTDRDGVDNGGHGPHHQASSPARRLRGAHPRHRRRRRDAVQLPGVRLLGHLQPCAARRQATASSRCSAGSSTRWPTWACGPTAAT